MELQEIFDTAVDGVLTQGKQAMLDRACVLKTPGPQPNKCAVGWLIPDDKYTVKLEQYAGLEDYGYPDYAPSDRLEEFQKTPLFDVLDPLIGPMTEQHFELLKSLQDAHDSLEFVSPDEPEKQALIRNFSKVAKTFGLSNHIIIKHKDAAA